AEDRGHGGGEAHRDGRTATTRPVPRVAPRHRTRGGGGAGPVGVVLPGDGAGGVLADVLVLHGRVGGEGDRGRPDAGRLGERDRAGGRPVPEGGLVADDEQRSLR